MPLCIAEIMCLVFGIVILVSVLSSGGFPMGGNKELRGAPAYITSGLLMAELPVAILVLCGFAGFQIHQKGDVDEGDWTGTLIELGILLVFAIPALLVAILGAKPRKRRKKKKRKRRDYDDYENDYDDRPRRSRDEDDDLDEQPRRRRVDDVDEPDDRPRRRRFDSGSSGSHRRRRRLDEDED
jgi:hypothetical protein